MDAKNQTEGTTGRIFSKYGKMQHLSCIERPDYSAATSSAQEELWGAGVVAVTPIVEIVTSAEKFVVAVAPILAAVAPK